MKSLGVLCAILVGGYFAWGFLFGDGGSGEGNGEGDGRGPATVHAGQAGGNGGGGNRSATLGKGDGKKEKKDNGVEKFRLGPPEGKGGGAAAGNKGGKVKKVVTSKVKPSTSIKELTSPKRISEMIEAGVQLNGQGRLVDGRNALAGALNERGITAADAAYVRGELEKVNRVLLFSPKVAEGDPFAKAYVVKRGEFMSKIAAKFDVPWQFISHINGDLSPRRMRAGMRLKVVQGPFHLVVYKSQFRVDVYLGSMYVRSLKCGLGKHGSTPVGRFTVKRHSKLANPQWVNPRTGERFHADDPKNPIGEYWVGLRGIEKKTELATGYGIHGTIDKDSIGREQSMGCVRLGDADIKLLFSMLTEEKSIVDIRP